ncbi:MAG: serine hydrolase domain-containing protein [Aulosira sp. ZfuVER01]|nr:serine hydrolase domain-containing protein [Aulosira sp. ZfuVER01]MDZ8000128.1 serine hydrolase domain-containing protein [Aulosira sp. DedVER01a]MDZ8055636.1 serine hydrolase domain-containing protein [Aulosira sp. ZfuCHP01]
MNNVNIFGELTVDEIAAHVIEPEHLQNIEIEEVNESREERYNIHLLNRQFSNPSKLNVDTFGKAMHNSLKDSVTGYILQLRHKGNLIYNLIWNWAQTPADKGQGWTEDTRMHVASVSKFLTAVGLVKLLDDKQISYDTKIINYLPNYWGKGKNIDKITFRHLLTHTSGFNTGSSSSSYTFMKSKVADGVTQVGSYDYENMNFGLCRILIPIINGNISKDANFPVPFPISQDQVWDVVTLSHYKNYMQANVFTPAGVSNVDFTPISSTKNALAYLFPHNNNDGWNSGDLASVAGGAGWRLSTKELLNVMNHVRRRNTIIPAQKAQYMLDNYFGIDQALNTPAGKIYNKNGLWRSNGRTEQSVAYFLPNDMELVVFVNSPIGTNGFSLRGIVKDTFVNSLTE